MSGKTNCNNETISFPNDYDLFIEFLKWNKTNIYTINE